MDTKESDEIMLELAVIAVLLAFAILVIVLRSLPVGD
jgi:hypothetical protein